MIDHEKRERAAPGAAINEAERITRIRQLLVGPAIADESARVDQSFDRLNQLANEQQETIAALQVRIQEIEENQRVVWERMQVRMLGLVEALLADEEEVRSRLKQSETLLHMLEKDNENSSI